MPLQELINILILLMLIIYVGMLDIQLWSMFFVCRNRIHRLVCKGLLFWSFIDKKKLGLLL